MSAWMIWGLRVWTTGLVAVCVVGVAGQAGLPGAALVLFAMAPIVVIPWLLHPL